MSGQTAESTLTRGMLDVLWHSLGMKRNNHYRALKWWLDNDNHRNHFATEPGCNGFDDIVALIASGLMKRGSDIPGGLAYYHVTAKGIRVAKQEFAKRKS